ncbi:TrbC family F-type conjugative pilus assembly protein [Methylococcus sp. EFPC2]|uniref:TrbC family F-type conjugative pilus assembly protein n=1 Tax=Methylococcus sp. EFPC2 TaxID=2812648 RepID=UPI001F071B05|nr:TrbC family F-type conjugative pilus assembly protein [Methylococcus sp. EFPC2]
MMVLGGLWATVSVQAEEDWLARSRGILNAVEHQSRPGWLNGDSAATDIRRQARKALQEAQTVRSFEGTSPSSVDANAGPKTFVIYASTSLGEAGLLDILEEASGRDDVLVVFRGMKPSQKVQAFIRELHSLARRFDAQKQPHIVIDPTRFRAAGVSVAPTLTLEENGRVLAKVQGVTGTGWLQFRMDGALGDGAKTLDLGTQGPTREIAEVDLIEEMQHRVAQIDWAGKKREALAHFWERTTFHELPEATEDRLRQIDLTVTAPREITSPDGTLIGRAGQQVNPLDRLPFTQRLVIFDATRPAQVELAKHLGPESAPRRVTYIATRLDRDAGWAGLDKIESALGAPIYLLPPDLRDRFRLERVPAVVEAKDGRFSIREFKVGSIPERVGALTEWLRSMGALLSGVIPQARAAETTSTKTLDPLCPDAEVWSGKLITDICWACLFPIRIAGGAMGDGDYPSSATDQVFCVCNDPNGIPNVGMTLGLWSPARMIELVTTPWCSPALGGMKFGSSPLRLRGTTGQAEYDNGEIAFFNYHYIAFPLYIMLDLFWDNRCNADGYKDFDLMYVSELDPTWNNDELAFFTNPEVALFANPVAISSCVADGAAATAGHPIDAMFWCAGTWGSMYPFAGLANPTVGADPRLTSLFAIRATAALHRRGLAFGTVGNDALCGGKIVPFIPKSQYGMTMFYPVADTDRRHAIGESTFRWGMGHTYPGPGDSHVYVLFRWQDCCSGI